MGSPIRKRMGLFFVKVKACQIAPALQNIASLSHLHYLGYISDKKEMARFHASCGVGLALSGWETFGLSILFSDHKVGLGTVYSI